jgi:hypothetical protein
MPPGGTLKNAGRKSNAQKLLDAQAAAESLASLVYAGLSEIKMEIKMGVSSEIRTRTRVKGSFF